MFFKFLNHLFAENISQRKHDEVSERRQKWHQGFIAGYSKIGGKCLKGKADRLFLIKIKMKCTASISNFLHNYLDNYPTIDKTWRENVTTLHSKLLTTVSFCKHGKT